MYGEWRFLFVNRTMARAKILEEIFRGDKPLFLFKGERTSNCEIYSGRPQPYTITAFTRAIPVMIKYYSKRLLFGVVLYAKMYTCRCSVVKALVSSFVVVKLEVVR